MDTPFGHMAIQNKSNTTIESESNVIKRNFVAIACGSVHTLALDSAGHVHVWGLNTYGCLCNNDTKLSNIPINISGLGTLGDKTIVAVATGCGHTLALDSTGRVHAWGYNRNGQLGNNSLANTTIPIDVSGYGSLIGKKVVSVAGGGDHTLALDSMGRMHVCGYNRNGQLGNNTFVNSTIPIDVSGFGSINGKTIIAVAAGCSHTLALDSTGNVHAWGYNFYGQLGNDCTTINSNIPINISGFGSLNGKVIVAIACGSHHTLAMDSTGHVHAWGYNNDGSLGNNSYTNSKIPIDISGFGSLNGKVMVAIACGAYHTLTLDSTGHVHAWGFNSNGQLGNNSTTTLNIPIEISGFGSLNGKSIKTVAAGSSHTLALDSVGNVHVWGQYYPGQYKDNTTADLFVPTIMYHYSGIK